MSGSLPAGRSGASPIVCPAAKRERDEPMAHQPLDDQPGDRVLGAGRTEAVHLPPSPAPRNHGRTVAAWTTTAIVLVGALVAALGVAFALVWLAWVGGAVIVAGVVIGKVLQVVGLGQTGSTRTAGGH